MKATILIVEDEGLIANDMKRRLQRLGYAVTGVANNGEDALALAQQNPPDLVIMDIVLQGPMDGIQTAEELQRRWDTPVVYLTAYSDPSTVARAKPTRPYGYLIKPFEERELATTIELALYHHRTEAQLREQATLLDQARDAILVCDLEGRIRFWNQGAERIYGWSSVEALDQRADQLLFGSQLVELQAANKAVMDHGEWAGEFCQNTKSGNMLSIESRWTLLRDRSGKPRAKLLINTDITGRKRLEGLLLRGQRLETIGALSSGIAHDLNNILTPILMAAPMLRFDLDPDQRENMLASIEASAKRGAAVVKQLLLFSRGVESQRQPLQLAHLAREVIQVVRTAFPKSVRIKFNEPANLWRVNADATQVHQVLLNLCVNARDAMPNGGTLTIAAENVSLEEQDARRLVAGKPGAYVKLRVADTGTGIPVAIIDKIFDPFFTTKETGKGTGLGLSTVLAIVKCHDGLLDVQSDIGQGTAFTIYWPVSLAEQPAASDTVFSQLATGRGELILVVDDEPQILNMTTELLEQHGYRVVSAKDGVCAVAEFVQRRGKIEAVIADLDMPNMEGLIMIRELRALAPGLPVLVCTGLSSARKLEANQAELQNLGVQTFLSKPWRVGQLLRALDDMLHPA